MAKDYDDIEKFYLRYQPSKGWFLIGLKEINIIFLGEITNKYKLRTMIEDMPLVLEHDDYVIKHFKYPAPNKWAVFHKGDRLPIVSNMKFDWAVDYVSRKVKTDCFCLC
jgi:hypothetical protein